MPIIIQPGYVFAGFGIPIPKWSDNDLKAFDDSIGDFISRRRKVVTGEYNLTNIGDLKNRCRVISEGEHPVASIRERPKTN